MAGMATPMEGAKPGSAASAAAKQALRETLGEVKDSLTRAGVGDNVFDGDAKSSSRLVNAIWDDFVPAQISSAPASPACWQATATAALAVACLLGAPTAFLQFLLCVPWRDLADFHKQREQGDVLPSFPEVTEAERRWLVNLDLESSCLEDVLAFIYRREWRSWLPVLMRTYAPVKLSHNALVEDNKASVQTRIYTEVVGAMLDGGTPLHFAAIQGGPPQVAFLLSQGAPPLATTRAGELPLELVPLCCDPNSLKGKNRLKQAGPCCWCGNRNGGVSGTAVCGSQQAQWALWRASFLSMRNGFYAWCSMLVSLLMCALGWWGIHATLQRPSVMKHASKMDQSRRAEARQRARESVQFMRQQAQRGRERLASAVRCWAGPTTLFDCGEPGGDLAMTGSLRDLEDDGIGEGEALFLPESVTRGTGIPNGDGRQRSRDLDAGCAAECAQIHFYSAVKTLQGLGLDPSTCQPRAVVASFLNKDSYLSEFDTAEGEEDHIGLWTDCNVHEREQAEIYSYWAQSVLLSFRLSGSQQGRDERGMQAKRFIDMASLHCKNILKTMEKLRKCSGDKAAAVASCYQRVLMISVRLLLDTVVQQSATRAGVQEAQQLLQVWERHKKSDHFREDDEGEIDALDAWTKTANSNLQLVEALCGTQLSPTQRLSDVYPATYHKDACGRVFLSRPASREAVQQLEAALVLAPFASTEIRETVQSAVLNATSEVAVRDVLRKAMNAKSGTGLAAEAIEALDEAISAAADFPKLQDEVVAARNLLERWERRAEAVTALEAETERARAPLAGQLSEVAAAEDYTERVRRLEAAIESAREANISVTKAKKTAKDMMAQLAAVKVARALQETLAHRQHGCSMLKALCQEAEEAALAATSSGGGPSEGLQYLQPVLEVAKKQLETERSVEALRKASASCKTLADLPCLEAAILAAKKAGAQEVDAQTFRAASRLRATLDRASRHRAALEASTRSLARFGRPEDADAVDQSLADAANDAGLLEEDMRRAQEAVKRWRTAAASEAKLARALKDATSSGVLSRAIQEATAVGVTGVGDAKRVHKLMQQAEAAMQQARDRSAPLHHLSSRIEAAAQGNVAEPFLDAARALECSLTIDEVKSELESALRVRADSSLTARSIALQAAVDRADSLFPGPASRPAENGDTGAIFCGGGDETKEALQAVWKLVTQAREVIAEDAREQERLDKEHAEQQRLKLQRQQAEKEERERERQERTERERAEKERSDREKAERREAERAMRQKQLQEQQAQAEKSRREQDVMERLARDRRLGQEREELIVRPRPLPVVRPAHLHSLVPPPARFFDVVPSALPTGQLTPAASAARSQPQMLALPPHSVPNLIIPDSSISADPLLLSNGGHAHQANFSAQSAGKGRTAHSFRSAHSADDEHLLNGAPSAGNARPAHSLTGASSGNGAVGNISGDAAVFGAVANGRSRPSVFSPARAEQLLGGMAHRGFPNGASANGGFANGSLANGSSANGAPTSGDGLVPRSVLTGSYSFGADEWHKVTVSLSGSLEGSNRLPSPAGSSFSVPSSASTTPLRLRKVDLGGLSWNPTVTVPASRTPGAEQSPFPASTQHASPDPFLVRSSLEATEPRSLWASSPSLAGSDSAFGTPLAATGRVQPASQGKSTERHLPPRPDSAGIVHHTAAPQWSQQEAALPTPQSTPHSGAKNVGAQMPATMSVQRPCKYFREGCCTANPCKFAHKVPAEEIIFPPASISHSSGTFLGPIPLDHRGRVSNDAVASEVSWLLGKSDSPPTQPITSDGALAFGAPGLGAFSGGEPLGGGGGLARGRRSSSASEKEPKAAAGERVKPAPFSALQHSWAVPTPILAAPASASPSADALNAAGEEPFASSSWEEVIRGIELYQQGGGTISQ